MAKGVPLYAAIPFMFTGPIINPVVLFSTYVALGNDWAVVWERSSVVLVVAIVVGMLLTFQFKTDQTKHSVCVDVQKKTFGQKLVGTIQHSIDEFFSVGKYLIIGALIAASMQTFMKTSILLDLGQQDWSAHFVMMGLAYLLSPLYFYQFPSWILRLLKRRDLIFQSMKKTALTISINSWSLMTLTFIETINDKKIT
ncbi:hypothetical protein BC359_13620 [Priestia flexa]|nr:hypothetical protein BC359_13620 [Priestia flexa]